MKKKVFRHLELFAGIGGFRKAIDLYCQDNNLISKCVGFSEIDKYAVKAYKANYNTSRELEIGDIREFTSTHNKISKIPNFDLLTAGFPCQAFSMMGKQKGFKDKRGNVFYCIVDILIIKQPKFVLLENVRNIKTHDNGKTYKEIIRSLNEDAGYEVMSDVFNTADYGLPQNRRRVFFFAIRKDLINEKVNFKFNNSLVKKTFLAINKTTSLEQYKNVLDNLLEKNVENKYYLSEKIKPTILSNGSKNFKSKSEINQLIARPLTATMVKMHRACQDNYYSDQFLNHPKPKEYLKLNITKIDQAKNNIRKLTPLEAFKLQGFNNEFYSNSKEAGLSNHQMYKQAGNAVSVNVVYLIIYYLSLKEIIKI